MIKSFNSISFIFRSSLWITFAYDSWCQIDLWFISVLLSLFVFKSLSLLLLLLQESFLASVKVFQVTVKHVWLFAYPFTCLRYVWIIVGSTSNCGNTWVVIIFHWVEESLFKPMSSISVKPFNNIFTLSFKPTSIIFFFLFNNLLWLLINLWLEGQVFLFLFIFDS